MNQKNRIRVKSFCGYRPTLAKLNLGQLLYSFNLLLTMKHKTLTTSNQICNDFLSNNSSNNLNWTEQKEKKNDERKMSKFDLVQKTSISQQLQPFQFTNWI